MDVSERVEKVKGAIEQQNRVFGFFNKTPYTMLARQELAFLHVLISSCYEKKGKIVDLGCFLGGSTYAMASGLCENECVSDTLDLIFSYDTFEWSKGMHGFLKDNLGFSPGDNFLPCFEKNIKDFISSINVCSGDVTNYPWNGDPIEILFVDISKSPSINDFLVHNFFPDLIPGSVVIQQDFNYPSCFWLLITMEYFKDYFLIAGDLDYNSRIYVLNKEIPDDAISEFVYKEIPFGKKEALINRGVKSIPEDTGSHFWLSGQINLGLFYFWENKKDIAEKIFADTAKRFTGDDEFLRTFFDAVVWTRLPGVGKA